MTVHRNYREYAWVFSALLMAVLAYHMIFHGFFANNGTIGNDYSYFLPMLLDGSYWQMNNGLAPPWFTPAFCGGVPAYANPQSLYYSVPQWLSFYYDPLTAVYATTLLFAAIGFVGSYFLLRWRFSVSLAASLLGATLFMFNGFYSARMLVGHLTFHAYMLVPLIASLLLGRPDARQQAVQWLDSRVGVAGILIAYMFYAGMVNGMLPALMAIALLVILYGSVTGSYGVYLLRLVIALVITVLLSLSKLVAAFAYLANFSRSDYSLPGIDNIWQLLQVWFDSLFWFGATELGQAVVTNSDWLIDAPDFDYGMTILPIVIVIAALLAKSTRTAIWQYLKRMPWIIRLLVLALLLIPLAMNYYHPSWNELLKSLPVIKNSSNLLRWFSVYIPPVMVVAALALDRIHLIKPWRMPIAIVMMVMVALLHAALDRGYYHDQIYQPKDILSGYDQSQQSGFTPQIDRIAVYRDQQGRVVMPIQRNDTLVLGASQLACYEPMFGYRLEHYPYHELRSGGVFEVTNDRLNIKKPACMLFPKANQCEPGAHYTVYELDQAKAFIGYRPVEFVMPWWQTLANITSLLTLIVAMLWLIWLATRRYIVVNRQPEQN